MSVVEDKKRLYVKWDLTQDQLKSSFSTYGTVNDVRIVPTFKVRPFAFITFEKEEGSEKALNGMKGKTITTQPLTVEFSTGRKDKNASSSSSSPPSSEELKENKKRLYVKWLVTSEQLKEVFHSYGTITDARVVPSYKLSPFAFVTFENESSATAALNGLNGKSLTTEPLRIEYVTGKKEKKENKETKPRQKQPRKEKAENGDAAPAAASAPATNGETKEKKPRKPRQPKAKTDSNTPAATSTTTATPAAAADKSASPPAPKPKKEKKEKEAAAPATAAATATTPAPAAAGEKKEKKPKENKA
jgi:RNA recognition motif-containing protein